MPKDNTSEPRKTIFICSSEDSIRKASIDVTVNGNKVYIVDGTGKRKSNIIDVVGINGQPLKKYKDQQNNRAEIVKCLINHVIETGTQIGERISSSGKMENNLTVCDICEKIGLEANGDDGNVNILKVKDAIYNLGKVRLTTKNGLCLEGLKNTKKDEELKDGKPFYQFKDGRAFFHTIEIPGSTLSEGETKLFLSEIDDREEGQYNPVLKHLVEMKTLDEEDFVRVKSEEKDIVINIQKCISTVEGIRKDGTSHGVNISDTLAAAWRLVESSAENSDPSEFFRFYIAYRRVTLSVYSGQARSVGDKKTTSEWFEDAEDAMSRFLEMMEVDPPGNSKQSISEWKFKENIGFTESEKMEINTAIGSGAKQDKIKTIQKRKYGGLYSEDNEYLGRIYNDSALISWSLISKNNSRERNYTLARNAFFRMNRALRYKKLAYKQNGEVKLEGFNLDVSLRNLGTFLLKALEFYPETTGCPSEEQDIKRRIYTEIESVLIKSKDINSKSTTRNLKNYQILFSLYDRRICDLLGIKNAHMDPGEKYKDVHDHFISCFNACKESSELLHEVDGINKDIRMLAKDYDKYFEKGTKDSFFRERIWCVYYRNLSLIPKNNSRESMKYCEESLERYLRIYRFLVNDYYRRTDDYTLNEFHYICASSGKDESFAKADIKSLIKQDLG